MAPWDCRSLSLVVVKCVLILWLGFCDFPALAEDPDTQWIRVFTQKKPEDVGEVPQIFRERQDTTKNLRAKDFAELSGGLSGAICLKTLVLLASALELFRKFFGAVRGISLWVLFAPLKCGSGSRTFCGTSRAQNSEFHFAWFTL